MKCDPIEITCPDCGSKANFEEPFEFRSQNNPFRDESRPIHRWGGWNVLERFPSQFSWVAPKTTRHYLRGGPADSGGSGYPLLSYGLVQCDSCHANRKHRLSWPADAYWQWEVRGEILWAWDKKHAEAILSYVKAEHRPARRSYSLRYIPSHFLQAKVRDTVVKRMEKKIGA